MRYEDSRQAAMHERFDQVLGALAEQMPDGVKAVELWRPSVVNRSGYADDQTEVWIRLGEDVPAFKGDKPEHFVRTPAGTAFSQTDGNYAVKAKGTLLFLTDEFGVIPEDHVVIDGEAYIVTEELTGVGFQKLTIEKRGSRFSRPARTEPVYRQMAMKARIV